MLIKCSKCKTKLRVKDEKIQPEGSKIRCSKCGAILSMKKTISDIKKEKTNELVYISKNQDKEYYEESPHSIQTHLERRKYKRFPFREDILIDGTKRCTCSDISELGLYISTIQTFEESSIIDITIPFKGKTLTLKAQVQYCQPGIGIGVMFIDITDEQKAIIKGIIESIK